MLEVSEGSGFSMNIEGLEGSIRIDGDVEFCTKLFNELAENSPILQEMIRTAMAGVTKEEFDEIVKGAMDRIAERKSEGKSA